ncbi:hypothetical protein ACH4L5_23170 [Streptomyces sp. NPDC017405]|uniref:hypothetical protein n=1 Tax=unclassified Streptomyces TaxID=2593676 RepID=UPI0037ADA32F
MTGVMGSAAVLSAGCSEDTGTASAGHGTGHEMGAADSSVPRTPALEKYVDPLPRPVTAIPDRSVYPGADYYEITMRQGSWRFHRDLGPATVWGYWAANPHDRHKPIGMDYLGPTISVPKDHPTVVKYRNQLPTTHMFQSVIDRIRKGDPQLTPTAPPPYKSKAPFPAHVSVWNVVHQHGGYTAPQSDGLPLQSFSPDGFHAEAYTTLDPGRVARNKAIAAYTNHERASLLWYHDHDMGMTSLNVYAGLAGLYLITDRAEERLGLPQGEFEVPLILQAALGNLAGGDGAALAFTQEVQARRAVAECLAATTTLWLPVYGLGAAVLVGAVMWGHDRARARRTPAGS